MTAPGKLIAIEGIDGSGKRTQVDLLTLTLKARGHDVYSTGFPQYDSWFGKMVGQFLNGDLGPLETVDPHFTTLLYAGDRFEAKPRLEAALNNGQIVLVDRYIGSNLAHQTTPFPAKASSSTFGFPRKKRSGSLNANRRAATPPPRKICSKPVFITSKTPPKCTIRFLAECRGQPFSVSMPRSAPFVSLNILPWTFSPPSRVCFPRLPRVRSASAWVCPNFSATNVSSPRSAALSVADVSLTRCCSRARAALVNSLS